MTDKHGVSVCKYYSEFEEVVAVVPEATCICVVCDVRDFRVAAICVA